MDEIKWNIEQVGLLTLCSKYGRTIKIQNLNLIIEVKAILNRPHITHLIWQFNLLNKLLISNELNFNYPKKVIVSAKIGT